MALRRYRPAVAALATAAVLALSACSGTAGEGGGGASDDAAAGEPTYGGTLRVGFSDDTGNYDPQQRPQLHARTISRQITDTLTDQDPETGEILPWLATGWEISEDTREFTFTLRDGVTFSDGTPFDAEVVKANFDRVVAIGPLAYIGAGYLRNYVGSEVLDEHTVKVTFSEPNAQFLQATATQSLGILSLGTLALDAAEVAAGNVVGTGPYVLDAYVPDQSITLSVREDYAWPSPLYENQGRGYYDSIEVSFVPEATTLAGALSSGQVDVAYILDAASAASVEASDAELVATPMPAISIPIVPFVYREVFSDERTRRALSLATDRQAIVDTVFQGRYEPATGVLTTTNPGYVDLSEELQHDPDAAAELLDEAGWTEVGDDGIRSNAAGERLAPSIEYVGTGTSTEALLQLLQQQWREVGIDLVLKPVAEASEDPLHAHTYDLSTWSQTRADPDVLRTVYSSFYENQSFLFDNADPELDALLGTLQTTTDAAARLEVSEQVQRLILERGYTVPLYDLTQYTAHAAGVSGYHTDIEGKPLLVDVWG
ncbi:ABC transporter substrate-binding protein [Cellulomonas hominis]|uniref:ABC transporter substrate-binding protein n=1 Tax=Cellulomonas hominis TaxID=156981 RepID=UPI001443F421|nr:ABC transporter substrate-binding protein [Cellulomonas hominis]NKY09438.1 ABC transporter substrate-binding protein [Cellulomonas hominis]